MRTQLLLASAADAEAFLNYVSVMAQGPLSPFASVARWDMTPGGIKWHELATRADLALRHPADILALDVTQFNELIAGRTEGILATLRQWERHVSGLPPIGQLKDAADNMRAGRLRGEALLQVEWLGRQGSETRGLLESYIGQSSGGRYGGTPELASRLQQGLAIFFGTADPAVAGANVAFQNRVLTPAEKVALYLTSVEKGFPKAPAAPRAGGSAALVLLLAGGAVAWKLLSQSSTRENVA